MRDDRNQDAPGVFPTWWAALGVLAALVLVYAVAAFVGGCVTLARGPR